MALQGIDPFECRAEHAQLTRVGLPPGVGSNTAPATAAVKPIPNAFSRCVLCRCRTIGSGCRPAQTGCDNRLAGQGSWSWLPVSVTEFRDSDRGNDAYLAWTAANGGHGYLINIQRSLNPGDARLHHAACHWINGTGPRGAGFVGSYIKICSETLDELKQWAVAHVGSEIRGCGTCRPAIARSDAA